jgi:hypothetical protein
MLDIIGATTKQIHTRTADYAYFLIPYVLSCTFESRHHFPSNATALPNQYAPSHIANSVSSNDVLPSKTLQKLLFYQPLIHNPPPTRIHPQDNPFHSRPNPRPPTILSNPLTILIPHNPPPPNSDSAPNQRPETAQDQKQQHGIIDEDPSREFEDQLAEFVLRQFGGEVVEYAEDGEDVLEFGDLGGEEGLEWYGCHYLVLRSGLCLFVFGA